MGDIKTRHAKIITVRHTRENTVAVCKQPPPTVASTQIPCSFARSADVLQYGGKFLAHKKPLVVHEFLPCGGMNARGRPAESNFGTRPSPTRRYSRHALFVAGVQR